MAALIPAGGCDGAVVGQPRSGLTGNEKQTQKGRGKKRLHGRPYSLASDAQCDGSLQLGGGQLSLVVAKAANALVSGAALVTTKCGIRMALGEELNSSAWHGF